MILDRSSVINALGSIVSGSGWITPSTTHRGAVFPRMVDVPLILISGEVPTLELVWVTTIPATFPCSIWSMDVYEGIRISSACWYEPAISLLLTVWYPVTTTSSREESSCRTTLMTVWSFRAISSCFMPMKLKTTTGLSGRDVTEGMRNTYLPSISPLTPMAVPFMNTDTPGMGFPSWSFAWPLIVRALF